MDLSTPMIDDRGKEHIDNLIDEELPNLILKCLYHFIMKIN